MCDCQALHPDPQDTDSDVEAGMLVKHWFCNIVSSLFATLQVSTCSGDYNLSAASGCVFLESKCINLHEGMVFSCFYVHNLIKVICLEIYLFIKVNKNMFCLMTESDAMYYHGEEGMDNLTAEGQATLAHLEHLLITGSGDAPPPGMFMLTLSTLVSCTSENVKYQIHVHV